MKTKENAKKLVSNKGKNVSITGYPTADDILDRIFSTFCIGK